MPGVILLILLAPKGSYIIVITLVMMIDHNDQLLLSITITKNQLS